MNTRDQHKDGASPADAFSTDAETIRREGYRVIDLLADAYDSYLQRSFHSPDPARDLDRGVGGPIPEKGVAFTEILGITRDDILPNFFNTLNPGMFQLMASPLPLVTLIELVPLFFNAQPYHTASAHIERVVTGWLGEMTGFGKETSGIFTKGGTASNLFALAMARVRKLGKACRQEGIAGSPPLIAYVSEQGHASLDKSMELLGIGADQLRKIGLREDFTIDAEELEHILLDDIHAGHTPFCIIANCGSAPTGVVDPIHRLADLAEKYGLWLHVDGAYGAFAAMLPELQDLFRGLDRADSLTMDSHKWLNIPYESSSLLVRDPRLLGEAFGHVPDYLGTLSREQKSRFSKHFDFTQSDRALKVWCALKLYGADHYRELIRYHIRLAQELAEHLRALPVIEAFHEPQLSIFCFRYVPEDLRDRVSEHLFYLNNLNRAIEIAIKSEDSLLITYTYIHKCLVLRISLCNHRIRREHLDILIGKILEKGGACDQRMRRAVPLT